MLTFCALWCDTWKTQVPRLQRAKAALGSMPVDFLTVSVDGRWTELIKPAGWSLLSDPGGAWCDKIGIDRIPYTFIVDQTGTVAWASSGVIRAESLEREIRRVTAPAKTSATVYLTFDDFPSGPLDEELLDILRRERVRATFFCIGRNTEQRPALARRAADEGHALQMHSWDHDAGDPQLDRCAKVLSKFGPSPTLYRPPGGQAVTRVSGGFVPIKTTVNPYDYHRPGKTELLRRVLSTLRPNSAILLHSGVRDTVEALPDIIRGIRARGFEMATLR